MTKCKICGNSLPGRCKTYQQVGPDYIRVIDVRNSRFVWISKDALARWRATHKR